MFFFDKSPFFHFIRKILRLNIVFPLFKFFVLCCVTTSYSESQILIQGPNKRVPVMSKSKLSENFPVRGNNYELQIDYITVSKIGFSRTRTLFNTNRANPRRDRGEYNNGYQTSSRSSIHNLVFVGFYQRL